MFVLVLDVGVVFLRRASPPGGAVATMLESHLTQEIFMHILDFVSKVIDFFLLVGVGVGVVHGIEAPARRHVA